MNCFCEDYQEYQECTSSASLKTNFWACWTNIRNQAGGGETESNNFDRQNNETRRECSTIMPCLVSFNDIEYFDIWTNMEQSETLCKMHTEILLEAKEMAGFGRLVP